MSRLDAVNDTFHDAYAAARRLHEADAPLFVLLADELVVHARRARRAYVVRPSSFHTIKAVSHAPVALYALVRSGRADAGALAKHSAAMELGSLEEPDVRRDCEETLRRTQHAIEGVATGALDLRRFAAEIGPLLLRLTFHATAIQLAELDARVEEEFARMNDEEKAGLQVVVTGDHQARSRSLGMQYFQKRLPGGAPGGERVLYAEGVTEEKEAVALVALQRLDREVAEAFFGDPKRLQSDVLGAAATKLLAERELDVIE